MLCYVEYETSSNFLIDRSKAVLLLYLCFVFICLAVLSVPCSLVVACWERANLLDLLDVMFFLCVFVTFPYVVRGQVW